MDIEPYWDFVKEMTVEFVKTTIIAWTPIVIVLVVYHWFN